MKMQQQILKKYPNAKVYTATTGYFVGYQSDDGIVNLLADLFLPLSGDLEMVTAIDIQLVETQVTLDRLKNIS